MLALIYKDLVDLKKTLLLLCLIILGIAVYLFSQNGPAIMVFPLIFILIPLILLGILFGSDAESNVDQYIIPGPVRRQTIILSRYVLVWGIAGLGVALALLLDLLSQGISYPLPPRLLIPAMAFAITLPASIQLPLMYQFGAERSRLVFVILYFSMFAGFSYLGSNETFILPLLRKLETVNLVGISLALLILTVAVNGLSLFLSVRIYEKKEF